MKNHYFFYCSKSLMKVYYRLLQLSFYYIFSFKLNNIPIHVLLNLLDTLFFKKLVAKCDIFLVNKLLRLFSFKLIKFFIYCLWPLLIMSATHCYNITLKFLNFNLICNKKLALVSSISFEKTNHEYFYKNFGFLLNVC